MPNMQTLIKIEIGKIFLESLLIDNLLLKHDLLARIEMIDEIVYNCDLFTKLIQQIVTSLLDN